jgi:RNA polymerase sigma factor (sigma-70 family)
MGQLAPDMIHLRAEMRLEDVPDPDVDVEGEVVARDEARHLYRALARMPERERQVLIWHYGLNGVGELSHRQIAERLGVSRVTAWRLERAGLERMRQIWAASQ